MPGDRDRHFTGRIRLPDPISVGLILSYKCSAACRHCMYACSPRWPADWISEADLEACLALLAGRIAPSPWGPDALDLSHGLHFTGGEPFLNFDLLLRATEIAEELRIPSTFVETNCSWCGSDAATRDRLRLLKARGLKGIMISVNPFFAEYVPFERTERCIRIGFEVFGANTLVYQFEYYRRFKRLGIAGRISLEDYLALAGEEQLARGVEMFLMGKATRALREFYPSHPAHTFWREPCRPPFIRAWHNHCDNYGNFMPGFCGGISLGRWRDLDRLVEEGIDPEGRPVLGFLASGDMEGLFRWAQAAGYRERPGGYISRCDLCLDIRSFLVSKGDCPELQPRQFYENLE